VPSGLGSVRVCDWDSEAEISKKWSRKAWVTASAIAFPMLATFNIPDTQEILQLPLNYFNVLNSSFCACSGVKGGMRWGCGGWDAPRRPQLSLVKTIARLHGGDCALEQSDSSATSFTLRFPANSSRAALRLVLRCAFLIELDIPGATTAKSRHRVPTQINYLPTCF
jgi:hypothetical protein